MKRLIVCADGTWNFRDQQDDETHRRHATNVTKVARAILPRAADDVDQVVYYHDGVGTHKGVDHLVGGAFGEGIESNIRDLYRFIVYNYADGDDIFLFGFSRGAYTVRTLAGFMNRFGLIQKFDDFFVPDLFKAYEAGKTLAAVREDPNFRRMRSERPCPPIHFIGVWDTVGALGLPGRIGDRVNDEHRYHDVELNTNIRHAYHALALDERRVPFKPSIWLRPNGWTGTLEQTWFAGVHCNVGGGYSPDGLANEALHWLVEKAETCGLQFDRDYLEHFRPCFNSTLNDSMSIGYRLLGEYHRPVGEHRAHGEQLHQSVIDRLRHTPSGYQPKNLNGALHGPAPLPVVNTQRIARGTPCAPATEPSTPPR